MRDLKVITPVGEDVDWNLDFDIINGSPDFVQYERNTQDQRASIAAYMTMGTIPGKLSLGIDWAGLYGDGDETLIAIDNEIKQAIQKYAGIPDGPNSSYMPVYATKDGKIQLSIYQG